MSLVRRVSASPALVVSCLALLVSLTGTSVAAVQQLVPRNSVGAKQLKNNAVTSAKVRNGSLLRADFKSGQLPRGSRGPRGETGPEGLRGPSNLYLAQEFMFPVAYSSTAYATQRSLNLPAGSWLVTATLAVDSDDPDPVSSVRCLLLVGGTMVDGADAMLGQNDTAGARMAITLQGGHTLTAAGAAELQCRGFTGTGVVLDPSITALRVETITNT